MHNLEARNPFLPPNADSACALEIVPVHDDMDKQIQLDHSPLNGRRPDQLGVAKEGSGTMVVSMKESQRLLLEEQEDCVNQFKIFGQVIELHTND